MAIRTIVWGENIHEQKNAEVRRIYPDGMHGAIAAALNKDRNIKASTATLQEPEHGLSNARSRRPTCLLWWGHAAHGEVADEIVERVAKRVWEGMGLIVLHSGHFSKIFKRLMGTPCALKWREAGERERIWVINRSHPIAAGPRRMHFESRMTKCTASLPRAGAARDGVHLLVPGRRGVPLRADLPARRRQHLLFPARATRPIRSITSQKSAGAAQRRELGAQPAPRWKDVADAPNAPIEKARRKSKRADRACTRRRGRTAMSVRPIRVLVIGTGDMAGTMSGTSTRSRACKVVAGVDISEARLKEFCAKHKIAHAFTDLDEAIAWGEFDAVTNVTPDAIHHPTIVPAAWLVLRRVPRRPPRAPPAPAPGPRARCWPIATFASSPSASPPSCSPICR